MLSVAFVCVCVTETRFEETEANATMDLLRLLRRGRPWASTIDAFIHSSMLKLAEPTLREEAGRLELWKGQNVCCLKSAVLNGVRMMDL